MRIQPAGHPPEIFGCNDASSISPQEECEGAPGLQAVDNYNGFAYIMSNFQHPGENGSKDPDWTEVNQLLEASWGNKLKTAIGYIGTEDGALPAFK